LIVSNRQYASMPQLQLQVVMCWCILGDAANAQRAFAKITDPQVRTGAINLCRQYGVPLRENERLATRPPQRVPHVGQTC
jgi:hypothetical protein